MPEKQRVSRSGRKDHNDSQWFRITSRLPHQLGDHDASSDLDCFHPRGACHRRGMAARRGPVLYHKSLAMAAFPREKAF